jgi:hypothetical protein
MSSIDDVVVEAEVTFKDDSGSTTSVLLGADGNYYRFNGVDHMVHPFKHKCYNAISGERSVEIANLAALNGFFEYADGRKEATGCYKKFLPKADESNV